MGVVSAVHVQRVCPVQRKLDRANCKACANSAPATHRESERIAFVQSATLTWLSSAANEVEGNHPLGLVRANFVGRIALARPNKLIIGN